MRIILGRLALGSIELWANILLIVSIFLPAAYEMRRPDSILYGYDMLIIGVFGPFAIQFGWFGNIALPCTLFSKSRWPRVIVSISFINSLFWSFIAYDNGTVPIGYSTGYYVWMGAMLLGSISFLKYEKWGRNFGAIK